MSAWHVSTPEECVEYVDHMGMCTWRTTRKSAGLPSLEEATPWAGGEVTNNTWFWKDDLHIESRLFYGMLIAPDIPTFVSIQFLPALIAAQGDLDAESLFDNGLLPINALKVYRHIVAHGPTASSALPWMEGSRMLYMAQLQQRFLLTKCGLTGRTRGTYGYIWDLCENVFPESFEQASKLRVETAREMVADRLAASAGVQISEERLVKMFRWQPL